jgi:hypothetical protein
MSNKQRMVFITPTWAGDLDHFRVMRASLEQSPLAGFDHYVVVQHEDIALFEEFRGRSGLTLLSTRDVLPESNAFPASQRTRIPRCKQLFWASFITYKKGWTSHVYAI